VSFPCYICIQSRYRVLILTTDVTNRNIHDDIKSRVKFGKASYSSLQNTKEYIYLPTSYVKPKIKICKTSFPFTSSNLGFHFVDEYKFRALGDKALKMYAVLTKME
jgi:hypothetical protein